MHKNLITLSTFDSQLRRASPRPTTRRRGGIAKIANYDAREMATLATLAILPLRTEHRLETIATAEAGYSCRRASIGWMIAALKAGIMPKKMPTPALKPSARATDQIGT